MRFKNWVVVGLVAALVLGMAGNTAAQYGAPPTPRIWFVNSTPSPLRDDQGQAIPGQVFVNVQWNNAPTGSTNEIWYEVLWNTDIGWKVYNRVKVGADGTIGTSGTSRNILSRPNLPVRINVALVTSGNVCLANVCSSEL